MIAISISDCVLIASREKSDLVKDLVDQLKNNNDIEATQSPKSYRPWGSFETIYSQKNYLVKQISVNPGGTLSLQFHNHRAEHWVVVEGEIEATIGESVKTLKKDQSTYVPNQMVHRIVNKTNTQAIMIEIQTGDKLSEEDIIRIEDKYNRNQY